VLMHLPSRDDVLNRLVRALRPGGWLVVEDFDCETARDGPALDGARGGLKIVDGLLAVLTANGADCRYGRRLPMSLQERGLIEIGAESHAFVWVGASPGAELLQASVEQVRDRMISLGRVSDHEIDAERALLNDSGVGFPSPTMWTVWGRRSPHGSDIRHVFGSQHQLYLRGRLIAADTHEEMIGPRKGH
jgi:hypothetical protein